MKIALGSDHAGFPGKEAAKKVLDELGVAYDDLGAVNAADSVDYPDFAEAVGKAVADGAYDRGLLFCGTGIGIGIAANKIPGVRAAIVHDVETAHLSREHNDANIMAMGVRNADPALLPDVIKEFLTTEFAGGRHSRRIEKISAIEKKFDASAKS
jgi:ribose 5-phosphate isomerase B